MSDHTDTDDTPDADRGEEATSADSESERAVHDEETQSSPPATNGGGEDTAGAAEEEEPTIEGLLEDGDPVEAESTGETESATAGSDTDDAESDDPEPAETGDDLGSDVAVDGEATVEVDEDDLLGGLDVTTTEEIEVPDRLVDQVIGQDHARDIVKKAAKQRRHVMMIGSPGTGKSMLAKAMSQLLPKEDLQDVLVYHNPDDGNEPKVRTVPAGKGEQIVDAHKEEARKRNQMRSFLMWIIIAIVIGYALFFAGSLLLGILAAGIIYLAFRYGARGSDAMIPNLLVNHAGQQTAPFEDATGAHAGALLGDVRHDPFQSGGMETPSHDRVEAGVSIPPDWKGSWRTSPSSAPAWAPVASSKGAVCWLARLTSRLGIMASLPRAP